MKHVELNPQKKTSKATIVRNECFEDKRRTTKLRKTTTERSPNCKYAPGIEINKTTELCVQTLQATTTVEPPSSGYRV